METSSVVLNERDKFLTKYHYQGMVTYGEKQIGHGRYFFPLALFLYLGNGIIYAQKKNLGNNTKFGAFIFLSAFPVCSILTKNLLGDEKLRQVYDDEQNSYTSSQYYENNKL